MAKPNQSAEERQEQMDRFVEYFREVPVQKYAAMYVGIAEQTAIDWLKKYPDFLSRVQQARADWVKKKAIKTKAEFALERLEHEIWKERSERDTRHSGEVQFINAVPRPRIKDGLDEQEV